MLCLCQSFKVVCCCCIAALSSPTSVLASSSSLGCHGNSSTKLPGPVWVVLTSVSSVLQKCALGLAVLCVCLPFRNLCVIAAVKQHFCWSVGPTRSPPNSFDSISLLDCACELENGNTLCVAFMGRKQSRKEQCFLTAVCRRLSGGAGVSLRDLWGRRREKSGDTHRKVLLCCSVRVNDKRQYS